MSDRNQDVAYNYWQSRPADLDSMLQGFSSVHRADIKCSNLFLTMLSKIISLNRDGRVLDVGCGIGRVSKNVLLNHFQFVDLLDPIDKFVKEADRQLGYDKNRRLFCYRAQDVDELPIKRTRTSKFFTSLREFCKDNYTSRSVSKITEIAKLAGLQPILDKVQTEFDPNLQE
ncbi:hypothetical protein GJ496_005395, partial [Pomphorhynchus laevis]